MQRYDTYWIFSDTLSKLSNANVQSWSNCRFKYVRYFKKKIDYLIVKEFIAYGPLINFYIEYLNDFEQIC